MSMFHRRSRSASASRPQNNASASASAHLAASQAFLSNRVSTGQLSASAAATALRTMSPTPTPIDQVQTKRMIQRQASLSTLSGSGRGRSRGGLQRQHSASSMTERTFRTPSPSPSRQPSRPDPAPAPPLPSIPQEYATSPAQPAKKKKRASSHGPAPPRVSSPPLTRPDARAQSVDRYGRVQQQPPTPKQKKSTLPSVNELVRTDSYNSVNFSRPLSPRPQSPPASPALPNGDRPTGASAVKGISPAEAERIQHNLAQTANQPVKKKKKKVLPGSTEGSHLQTGTMASKPVVTPLASGPESDDEVYDDAREEGEEEDRVGKRKNLAALTGEATHFPSADVSPRADSDSDSNADRTREKRAQRASGKLAKQPSVVREDWEGEQQDGVDGTSPSALKPTTFEEPSSVQHATTSAKRATNTANVSRKIEDPGPPPAKSPLRAVPQESQPISSSNEPQTAYAATTNLQVTEPRPPRETSLSPSRSMRFSDRLSSDLTMGKKHEPLPRSVSPAKSALKHHSPSPGGAPGSRARGSSITPSEASDISSASIDGQAKRKKSARVSFDAQPEIVGTSASNEGGESKKGWFGSGKSKPFLTTIPSNDDMEELMKPRPQLPSFGSVRGQKSRDANDTNTTQSPRAPPPSTASTPSKPIYSSVTMDPSPAPSPGVSSDHAVGGILAQEAQRQSNLPLPPEVTSVQGTLSYSDSESDYETERPSFERHSVEIPRKIAAAEEPSVQTPERATNTGQQLTTTDNPANEADVPILQISPPTPAPEQANRDDQWNVAIPGGFPVSREGLAQLESSQRDERNATDAPSTYNGLGIAANDESDSDNDSIYSDTAEHPDELDGTGFGSINAIVDSPVVAGTPTRIASPPESPTKATGGSQSQSMLSAGAWEETQARWRDLAEQTRKPSPLANTEEEQSSIVANTPRQTAPAQQPQQQEQVPQPKSPQVPQGSVAQPRQKRQSAATVAALASIPAAARTVQEGPIIPPRKKKKQGSMQQTTNQGRAGPTATGAPFKQSMRTNPPLEAGGSIPKTMRNPNRNSAPVAPQQQQRQAQPPPPMSQPAQPRGNLQKKHLPSAAAASASAPSKAPAPIARNDSDSDSSFRKARRSKSTSGGAYTMRRSMRGAAEPTMRENSQNRVRSMSPVGRQPFASPSQARTMRTSMRGSGDTPSLRGSVDAKRSSSLFGRNPDRRQESVPPVPSAYSRVVDSDEEDAPRQRGGKFRSRFADDSDDEADYTPVRGIPRRTDEGDSTDLEDSSDEGKRAASRGPSKLQLQIPSDPIPRPGTAEPMSPNTAKKRGLFSRLRGKKNDEALSPVAESPQPPPKVDPTKPSNLGFSSKAERDRMIAQTQARLEASSAQPPPQGKAKLQRRHTPQRGMSDSWPLPPKMADYTNDRPNTADGPPARNGSTRLGQGSMRTQEPVEAFGRSGKKKRFPMLRKAFGLKD
ncbi:hypothetical protein PV11_08783 [Exophiala sideris]|uniref:Uncharacterized protein n=1 Tax=Exophiala sideris TaxID=1016849 RepID=A0A0D1Y7Z0_9EURO|nr:hypothetical protein PV11_08783 [Exophiala sideris]